MAVTWRKDSIIELSKKKTLEELQEENEQLTAQVDSLSAQLTDTQLALCDVYEQILVATAQID